MKEAWYKVLKKLFETEFEKKQNLFTNSEWLLVFGKFYSQPPSWH